MRSKFLACAALSIVGSLVLVAPVARAADPKSKAQAKKKGANELMIDDKAISKQLQWEDKVMGSDDKRAELDKIARAQAINKAAAEKAEREKAEKEKQAAREAAQPKPQVKRNEVALPSVPDEPPARQEKAEAPPPPPVKTGDDKFIDKLLKEDGSSKKRTASKSDDKELDQLLAGTKESKPAAAKSRGKKGDLVDNLLDSADKGPAMPAPKTKPALPEWATKPDVAPAAPPPPSPILRPQQKWDDGVIHVVQGASLPGSPRTAPPPPRVAPPPPPPTSRRVAAKSSSSGDWSDPFTDAGSKRTASPRERASRDPFADDASPPPRKATAAPAATRRESPRAAASGNWNDPFADAPGPERKPAAKRGAPAAPPARAAKSAEPAPRAAWKDPFTEAPAPSRSRAAVAMRDSTPARAPAPAAAPAAENHSRWGILKKRAAH